MNSSTHSSKPIALFAVIGHPVSHSKSPSLFNQIYKDQEMNYEYLAFDNPNAQELIERMRQENINGYSVTVPHKETVFSLVDHCDPLASALKSVNTVVNKNGTLTGYNTDGIGAVEAIENKEMQEKTKVGSWRGKDILFLGNGGAARGIALSMIIKYKFEGRLYFMARNENKSQALIQDIEKLGGEAHHLPWGTFNHSSNASNPIPTLIVQTTTIGMQSSSPNQTPLSKEDLIQLTQLGQQPPTVFDIVYTPLNTRLLSLAKECGMPTIDGLDMFLSQANHQLELWTGRKLPLAKLREFFLKK